MKDISRATTVIIENATSRGRGRPRSFDTEEALKKAAILFWERGYEGTSVQDLTAEMGITTQSLYAAFGSKAELYRRALAWYQQEVGMLVRQPFADEPDVSRAIEQSLRHLATQFTRSDLPHGCMRSTGLIRCARQHEEVAAHVAALRAETAQAIKARLDRAKEDGQMASIADTPALAGFINALIVGMSVAAQDGATAAELLPFAGMAVAAVDRWRAVKKKRSSKGR